MKIKIQTGNKPYLSISKRISKSSKLAVLKYGFLLFCSSMNLLAQSENVGIGTNTPDNSAVLDVNFSNPTYPKGLLIPRLTSTDRGNISLPAKGLIIFNTTTNKFEYNDGTPGSPNWVEIFSSGNLGLTQNYIFVGNASNQAVGVALSGDATITSAGAITIANSAITSAKISDGTITDSDINASAAIAYSKLSLSNSIVAGDITADAVTSAKILDGTIANGDISGSAAITVTKLANGTNNQILRTNGTTPEWWTPDYANGSTALVGDVTGTLGATTIATGTVTSAKIADGTITDADINASAAIAYSKLSLSGSIVAGDIASDAVTTAKILDANVTSAKIADGTIANADINANAGIAVTKLANGTSNQILRTNGTTPEWWTPNYADASTSLVGDVTGTIGANTIAIGAVTSAKIADGTISNADISGTAAIAYSKLSLTGTIVAGDLAADAVTTAKILDGNVTSAKIADATIANADISTTAGIVVTKLAPGTASQILRTNGTTTPEWWTPDYITSSDVGSAVVGGDLSGTVANAQIISGAVGTAEITDASITNTDISGSAAIAYSKLALTNSIVAGDITSDAVTTAKILDGNVTSAKIADATIANADISTTAGIVVTKLAPGTASQILRTNGTTTPEWWTPDFLTNSATLTGDVTGTIGANTIANNTITSAKIVDATITDADLSTSGVVANTYGTATKVAQVTVNDKGRVTAVSEVTIAGVSPTNSALTNSHIWVGDATNTAKVVAISGDIDLAANGTVLIQGDAITSSKILNGTIANADISGTAGIAVTKLANGTDAQILRTNGTTPEWWTPNYTTSADISAAVVGGDLSGTVSNAQIITGSVGTSEIADASITNTDISASAAIAYSKLALTNSIVAGDITSDAVTTAKILDGNVTSAKIADATIANADISTTAGIAVTKLANGTANQILRTNGTSTPEWWTPDYTTSSDISAAVVGGDLSGTVSNAQIISGSVGTSEIADASITNTDINASAAIAYSKLALTNSIVAGDITSDAVTTAKILDGNVTSAKIADATIANADISTTAGIAVTKLANGTANQILRTNGTSTPEWWTPDYTTSSDISAAVVGGDLSGTVSNAQIISGSVGTSEIADASITNTDISASAAIAYSKLALTNSIVAGDITSDAVTTAKILDGNVTSAKIADATIANADISTTAGIAVTKLANGTANQILRTNGTSTPEWWTPDYTTSSDISSASVGGDLTGTVANAQIASGSVGTAEITDGSITNTDISASAAIAYSKLALTNSILAGDITSDAVTTAKILDGNVTSAKIADATIANADISTTAGIAVTKLANGTANQILRTNGTSTPEWWTPDYTTSSDISSASVGGDLTGTVANAQIASGSVGTAEIADASITNTDISASAAIAYSKLALTNSIVAGDITSDAITTVKILDGNVTSAKIADGTIANADINASAAIAYSKLSLTNSIVAADLTTDAVTTVKIADANVTDAKLGTNLSLNKFALADSKIVVGNASGQASAVSLSGDASITNTGALTVSAIRGVGVSATTPTTNQVLSYDGSNWSPKTINKSRARAYLSANQSISNNTITKVLFDAESFDSNNDFDISNGTFTAPVAGYYQVNSRVRFLYIGNNPSGNERYSLIMIYKNGSLFSNGNKLSITLTNNVTYYTTANEGLVASDIVYLTQGETIDIRVQHTFTAARSISLGESESYCSIHLLSE